MCHFALRALRMIPVAWQHECAAFRLQHGSLANWFDVGGGLFQVV
jgi:hypothetical protein